jgi:branched-chain amino acid transport system ATP-binding protein
MSDEALRIRNLSAGYGKLQVLSGVNLRVGAGELVGLIGHNGAGKTTLLRVIAGLHRPMKGSSVVFGTEGGHNPLTSGVAFVPQGRGAFANLTVAENIEIGLWSGARISLSSAEGKHRLERVLQRVPLIEQLWNRPAGQLSGGQRSLVAIGRALVVAPRILLLDEPSTGLAPAVIKQVMQVIDGIRSEDGAAVVLVEQSIPEVMDVADYVYVLKGGAISRSGKPAAFSDLSELLLEF